MKNCDTRSREMFSFRIWQGLALLAALLPAVLSQDPRVQIRETTPVTFVDISRRTVIYAERDNDVIIPCFVEDLPPTLVVKWRRISFKDESNFFISTDLAVHDYTKYSIEKPTFYTWRLRIKGIQVQDEGIYQCFVQLTETNVASAIRDVIVQVPPMLDPEQVTADTTVTVPDEVKLNCNASGRPQPTIEWTRLGGALLPIGKERHLGAELVIPNVQPQDRGWYRCHVFNSIGFIKRDIVLDVRFKPQVVPAEEIVYQKKGYAAELQCLAEANPAPNPVDMRWFKDGLSFSVSTERYILRTTEGAFSRLTYELIIDGVQEDDYGTYTCQIANSLSENGPSRAEVSLRRSDEPTRSPKLGVVIQGGGWRERIDRRNSRGYHGEASGLMVSLATITTCLVALIVQLL